MVIVPPRRSGRNLARIGPDLAEFGPNFDNQCRTKNGARVRPNSTAFGPISNKVDPESAKSGRCRSDVSRCGHKSTCAPIICGTERGLSDVVWARQYCRSAHPARNEQVRANCGKVQGDLGSRGLRSIQSWAGFDPFWSGSNWVDQIFGWAGRLVWTKRSTCPQADETCPLANVNQIL